MFLMNSWYAVAWGHELGRSLFARTVCGKAMVFYRREDGRVAALEDLCWHRLLPLSKGMLEGDFVRCKYHGFVYDSAGQCVRMTAQDAIPTSARVANYPVAEKHRLVWVWPGDAAKADPSLIPDLHWFADPAWAGDGTYYHFRCDYRLLIDNLMDLTHETYVHPESIGSDEVASAPIKTEVEGEQVVVSRWMLDHQPANFWRRQIGGDKNCDRWQVIRWTAPATIAIDVGVAITGTGAPRGNRGQGVSMFVLNTITPETETSCHYFFGVPRNYKIDDRELSIGLMKAVAGIFNQDRDVLEAQQQAVSANPERALSNVNIDAGSVRTRRILQTKIRAEQASVAAGMSLHSK